MIKADKKETKKFERPESGSYSAVCQSVHDIGIQNTTYKGKADKKHQIIIVWEIDEKMKEGDFAGKHFTVSRTFTLSMGEKSNLRKTIVSWRGQDFASDDEAFDFDIEKVIGKPCLVTLTTTKEGDKEYQNVSSVVKLPKGMNEIKAELPPAHIFKWIENKKESVINKTAEALKKEFEATEADDSDSLASDQF
jgi:hypothetical protein